MRFLIEFVFCGVLSSSVNLNIFVTVVNNKSLARLQTSLDIFKLNPSSER